MIFLAGAVMVTIVLLVIARPLFSRQPQRAVAARSVVLYKDQLAEVDRDVDRGVLGPTEAEAARREIERRLLRAARDEAAEGPAAVAHVSKAGRLGVIALLGITPLAVALLYLQLGAPAMTGDGAPDPSQAASLDAVLEQDIAVLEERIANAPEDVSALVALGRAQSRADRPQEAVTAYAQANRITGGRVPALAGEYAAALTLAAGGTVTVEAQRIFRAIREAVPDNPQARFYLALAAAQREETAKARAALDALLTDAPPDAPWRARVATLLEEIESGRFTAPEDAPSAAEISAAEEEEAMVRGMVERLATRLREETPDDLDGWRRLAKSYAVLGDQDAATAAYREVLRLSPDDPEAAEYLGAATTDQ